MSIRIGEIDLSQILENEFRIGVLERTLEWILAHNQGKLSLPTEEVTLEIRKEIVSVMQKKYPNSEIELKEEEPQPVAS
jgi:hypothetical protein